MRAWVVAAVVLAGLAGSVGAFAKEKLSLNAADTAAARAVLITKADLQPAGGWKGGPTKPDFSEPSCSYYHPNDVGLVITGAAENDWSRPDRALTSGAAVLRTTHMVEIDFKRSATAANLRCLLINEGATNVAPVLISFPKLGNETIAYRATYQAPNGSLQVVEIALIGHGRTEVTAAEIMAEPAPLSTLHSEVVRLATIMTSRAKV
jgi:hypothetical protein